MQPLVHGPVHSVPGRYEGRAGPALLPAPVTLGRTFSWGDLGNTHGAGLRFSLSDLVELPPFYWGGGRAILSCRPHFNHEIFNMHRKRGMWCAGFPGYPRARDNYVLTQ